MGEGVAHGCGRRGVAQDVAATGVGKTLGEFGQDLQVLFGGLLGDQQDKQQADRFSVRCVEGHRRAQAKKGAAGRLEALDPPVRNGNAAPESGRTELLAREKTVENRAAGDALMVFEEESGLLEDAFFAARIKVEDDVLEGQEVMKVGHKTKGGSGWMR